MRSRREGGEVSCPVGFATQRPGRVPQCRPPMGLVSRGQGARRKSMPVHRRRRATKRSATTAIGPKGYGAASRLVSRPRKRVAVHRLLPATPTCRFHRRVVGGMAPSSSLPFLGDGGTSPSSRRLEFGTMAHATGDTRVTTRTSQGAQAYSTVRRAPRGEQTPLGAVYRRPQ